jgi:hypothetical protein
MLSGVSQVQKEKVTFSKREIYTQSKHDPIHIYKSNM